MSKKGYLLLKEFAVGVRNLFRWLPLEYGIHSISRDGINSVLQLLVLPYLN